MKYELVGCYDPILYTETDKFDFSNSSIDALDLVSNLAETMLEEGGIGLSANQCGLNYRVCILKADELIPIFNPKIVDYSQETIYLEEGCLSFPDLYVKIKRPRRIKVRYAEPNGNVVTKVYEDLTARVLQHEIDHLMGIAYINRANKLHLEIARKKLKIKNRRQK